MFEHIIIESSKQKNVCTCDCGKKTINRDEQETIEIANVIELLNNFSERLSKVETDILPLKLKHKQEFKETVSANIIQRQNQSHHQSQPSGNLNNPSEKLAEKFNEVFGNIVNSLSNDTEHNKDNKHTKIKDKYNVIRDRKNNSDTDVIDVRKLQHKLKSVIDEIKSNQEQRKHNTNIQNEYKHKSTYSKENKTLLISDIKVNYLLDVLVSLRSKGFNDYQITDNASSADNIRFDVLVKNYEI